MRTSRFTPVPIALVAIVGLTAGVAVASAPTAARAVTVIDASEADFSFVSPTDVLAGAGVGEYADYDAVATIDGVVIDARLTVVELFNSLAEPEKVFVSQNAIDIINGLKALEDQPLEATGCYRDILDIGQPTTDTQPTDYLVGAETFEATTAWDKDSPFLVGSLLEAADEAEPDDAVADATIRTELHLCGGFDASTDPWRTFSFPGYVRLQLDFTTGPDRTPVQLANLTVAAYDIDGGQYVRLFSPLPDSYTVASNSLLEVCGPEPLVAASPCSGDYAGSPAFLEATESLEFYGEAASQSGEVDEWSAEATYTEPISSITYQFGEREGSGGSLELFFEPILTDEVPAAPELAATGPSRPSMDGTLLVVGFLALLVGAALVARRSAIARG